MNAHFKSFLCLALTALLAVKAASIAVEDSLEKRGGYVYPGTPVCDANDSHCIYITGSGYLEGANDGTPIRCSQTISASRGYGTCQYPDGVSTTAHCDDGTTIYVSFQQKRSEYRTVQGKANAVWSSQRSAGGSSSVTNSAGDDLYLSC